MLIAITDSGRAGGRRLLLRPPRRHLPGDLESVSRGICRRCSRARSTTSRARASRPDPAAHRDAHLRDAADRGRARCRARVPRRYVQHRWPAGRSSSPPRCAGVGRWSFPMPPVHRTCWSPSSPAIAGGAIWGGIVGLLKARTGAHEVIVTIMLNYVALLTGLVRPAHAGPASGARVEQSELARRPAQRGLPELGQLSGARRPPTSFRSRRHSSSRSSRRSPSGSCSADRASDSGSRRSARTRVPLASPASTSSRCTSCAMLIAGGLVGLAGADQVLGQHDTGFTRGRGRRHRLRRDHGGAARPVPALGRVLQPGSCSERCRPAGTRCRPPADPDRHRAGHPVGDRALHRGASAGARGLPPAEARGRSPEPAPTGSRHEGGRQVSAATASAGAVGPDRPREGARAQLKVPIVLDVFACSPRCSSRSLSRAAARPRFHFASPSDFVQLSRPRVASRRHGTVAGDRADRARCAVASVRRLSARRPMPIWLAIVFALLFMFGFLTWAAGQTARVPSPVCWSAARPRDAARLRCARRRASPSARVSSTSRSRASCSVGAFSAAVVASAPHSAIAGLLAAVVAGVLVSLVLAAFAIRYLVDQVIVGVVLNVLVTGLTNFFYTKVLRTQSRR